MVVVGDTLPKECAFTVRKTDTCPATTDTVTVEQVFGGKRSVIFAVPGAFTPTCSEKHLPGFVALADELKAAGAEVIACVSGKAETYMNDDDVATAPNLLLIAMSFKSSAPSSSARIRDT